MFVLTECKVLHSCQWFCVNIIDDEIYGFHEQSPVIKAGPQQ